MEAHERYLLPEGDSVFPDTLHQTSVSHQCCCHDNRNKAVTTPVQTGEVEPAGAAMLLTEVCVCQFKAFILQLCVCFDHSSL